MLQLIDNKKNFYFYLFIFLFLTTINFNINNSDNLISFKIRDINVVGLSYKNNINIQKKINIFKNRNIFTLRNDEFKKILDQYSIIGSYEIKKVYPDKIQLNLKRANFLAFTYIENNKYIIGDNNKLINIENFTLNDLNLPVVFTNGNYEKFINLKKIIDETNFNINEIESFYYFQIGRWDLKTKSGLIIKLPDSDLKEAISRANIMIHDKKLSKFNLLDMRIKNYIITSNE
tara:strand:- start:1513 stop:2208 length:696 start_codon:yes stop_codon:yes gene_type:complete